MAQESIPAKSTKDLEFHKYINKLLRTFWKILGNTRLEKDKKHLVLNSTRFVLKSGIGNVQILRSLSFHIISLI